MIPGTWRSGLGRSVGGVYGFGLCAGIVISGTWRGLWEAILGMLRRKEKNRAIVMLRDPTRTCRVDEIRSVRVKQA